jgi:hypothetical protein
MRLRIRLGIILNMDDVASTDAICEYVGGKIVGGTGGNYSTAWDDIVVEAWI